MHERIYKLLRWSEKYTGTDMVYLAKGSFWLTNSQTVSSILSLLIAISFANLVPADVYGGYKYILSIAGILSLLTLPGINVAVIQAIAKGYDGSLKEGLYKRMQGSIVLMVIAGAMSVYYFINDNILLSQSFILVALFSPVIEISSAYGSILNAKQLFKKKAIYTIVSQICATAIMLFTISITDSLPIILASNLIPYSILNSILLKKSVRTLTNTKTDQITSKFGMRLSAINSLGTIATYIDSIILWQFLGPTQVAIYSFAQSSITPFKTFLKSILNLALPKFATNDITVIKKTLLKKVLYAFILFIIPIGALAFFMPYIFDLFFPKYTQAVPYAQVLTLSLLLFPEKLLGIMFMAHVKEKEIYTINIINPIIKIILLLVLIPLYGIWGAVCAILIQQGFAALLSFVLFLRI